MFIYQTESANGSSSFSIKRGVKQGDILSAILFNCVLDLAFDAWKSRLTDEGIFIATGMRLTNSRYADDVLIYARSLPELEQMTTILLEELEKIGLELKVTKTNNHYNGFRSISSLS